MSILIEGISSLKEGLYQVQDGKIHAYKGNGGKVQEFDLVEVPFPHGRLIDGIDLLKAITENAYIIHHGHNEVEYGMSCFGIMQAISEAPTIIEAEEAETADEP